MYLCTYMVNVYSHNLHVCPLYTIYVHSSVNVIAEELFGSYIAPFQSCTNVRTYKNRSVSLSPSCSTLQSNGNLIISAPGTFLWRGANFVHNGSSILPNTRDNQMNNFGYSGMSVRQARVSSPDKLGE